MSGMGVDPTFQEFSSSDGLVRATLFSDGINETTLRVT
jgi:hypothetical protein